MRLPVLNDARAHTSAPRFDPHALERDLRREVRGEVRFDTATRGAYSTDGSNYRRVPACVVIPKAYEDVEATIGACLRHGVPLVSRGGGTSLDGQCVTHGVVIDYSKYLCSILDIDPSSKTARVQPGVVHDSLNGRTIKDHDLAFGPDPSTHTHCTFGGMIGNNSCGIHSIIAGRTSDNVVELDILTGDGVRMRVGATDEATLDAKARMPGREGEVYRDLRALRDRHAAMIRSDYPNIPRRVSGYNLPDLLPENGFHLGRALGGSEGTCVAMLEATVRLVDWPKKRALVVLGYNSVYEAGDHVEEIMAHKPIGLEGIDDKLVRFMKTKGLHPEDIELLPDGHGWLLVEFGGPTRRDAERAANGLMEDLRKRDNPPQMELLDDEAREKRIWEVRESGLGATAFVPGMADTWPGWEDAAVPPRRVGEYLRKFRKLLNEFSYDCALYGHFGQGCIHCRINFDLVTPEGIAKYHEFVRRAAQLVVSVGGSLSAEHGDGLSKSELLTTMFGEEMVGAFREFKRVWDPACIMNPGKIVDAPNVTADLRLGAHYRPRELTTTMTFPGGSPTFERAAVRCVGVGKCRRREDVFMCPSYIATQEEIHTTRGRARLLFEMVRGDYIESGWRSEAVHESLDLCLACKGCKKECPVSVDMASYKAEFLHHHYGKRLRPRQYYAMGFIGALADVASVAPGIANWSASAPGVSSALKWLAGIDPGRRFPTFADRTFRRWFSSRERDDRTHDGAERERVLLVPDAFNDHFFPDTLIAATRVLEAFGYRVEIPPWRYPAIRPMIHYGFLDIAQKRLRWLVERLDEYASEGISIVGTEPSTMAVLRDETERFFPKDPRVARLCDSARLLSEFLADHCLDRLPQAGGTCVFHAHCHQKAVLDADKARKVLKHIGFDVAEPDPGCCGMAGSFGFERKHAALSRKIGEMSLFPRVREAKESEPVIIEGFSCREQIKQDTNRVPQHFAEVVAGLLEQSGRLTPRSSAAR